MYYYSYIIIVQIIIFFISNFFSHIINESYMSHNIALHSLQNIAVL